MPNSLKLKARWEHKAIPAGQRTQRGLLIEVTGQEVEERTCNERPPINLALVIDRSGSMNGGRLEAARKAAVGITRQLRKRDRLSIVAYDTDLLVLLDGRKQNKSGRSEAEGAIAKLRTGGCTDLGGGWLTGANCVAKVMEREGFEAGHVIVLSDGHANHGITDPGELARHATELAERGVTSSCVGIGHGYSPLQLDAIAEAGRGQLHHSESPEEIVDVVLGELGEMTRIAAHSAQLVLHFPECASFRQLTAFREEDGGHYIKLRIGDLPAGRTRRIAFLFDISEHTEAGEVLPFKVKLAWKNDSGNTKGFGKELVLTAVTPNLFDAREKNREVAQTIAELWLSRMGYDAMVLNERGLYTEAVSTFECNDIALEELIKDLSEQKYQRLAAQKSQAQSAVSEEWTGAGKLHAFTMAKKFMRSETDHSGRTPGDWSDKAQK